MRRSLALMLVVLALASTLPTSAVVDASESDQPLVQVERDVKIENGGIVFLNDTFTLSAPPGGELQVSRLWAGFHESISHERHNFEIFLGGDWVPVGYVDEELDNFSGYVIEPLPPVTLREEAYLRLRVSYLFVNLVGERSNRFEAIIPVFPTLRLNISSLKIRVEFPLDAEYEDMFSSLNFTESVSDGVIVLYNESEAVSPLGNENAEIYYYPSPDDEYLLDCQELERHVTIRQGTLRVEDSYAVINRGALLRRFHLVLPAGASNVKARDGVGDLVTTTDEEEDAVDAYVSPRYAWRTQDRFRVTVAYTMPKMDYVTSEGGKSTLTYPVYGFPHYVRDLSAVVTLPEGGRLLSSQPESASAKKKGSTTDVTIELGARLPSERPEIVVELSVSPIASLIRPLGLLLVAAGAIGGVYVLRRRRREVLVKPVVVERPKLSDYVDQQIERISLFKDLEGLQQDLDDEKIDRDEFDQRSGEINRRLEGLERSTKQLGRTLEEEDPDLRERLAEIRRVEEELDRIKDDLRNLEVRLRARRVTRRDFERRRRERLRRRSRAVGRIEQAIVNLGDEG